jgi:hypothetical protein
MRFHYATRVLAILSAAVLSSASPSTSQDLSARDGGLQRRATICNGHAELCERSFGSVTYVGTHDSYAIGLTNNCALFSILVFGRSELTNKLFVISSGREPRPRQYALLRSFLVSLILIHEV